MYRISRFIAALCAVLWLTPAWTLEAIQGPMLTMDPNGLTPLAGLIELTTDEPTRVTLDVTGGGDVWQVERPGFVTNHSVPLLGLKSGSSYTVRVSIENGAGDVDVIQPALTTLTDPLPTDFPQIDVHVSNPALMQPGYTLIDHFGRNRSEDPALGLYSMILDSAGDVVWYSTEGESAMRLLPNGHLLYRDGSNVIEQDLLGNIVRSRRLQDPGIGLHHDLVPTDNGASGSFLSLSREIVSVDDFPTSDFLPDSPPMTTDVLDEPAVEFNAADGSVMTHCRMVDMIDSTRIGYQSLNAPRDWPDSVDWVHNNAINEDGDDLIVSVRHQDAVIKFTRDCELIWILGNHHGWAPEFQRYLLTPLGSPFEWQYHQHAPMVTDDGTLLLFDNGNHRAMPFDGTIPVEDETNYSRAAEYEIDEANMTVRQIWEYGSPATATPVLFSRFISDADRLPNGNTLIDFGGNTVTDGVANADLGLGDNVVRIVETDHGTPALKVFDVSIFNPPDPESRISAYRAERVPSLYGSGEPFLVAPSGGSNGAVAVWLCSGLAGLAWYRRRRLRAQRSHVGI